MRAVADTAVECLPLVNSRHLCCDPLGGGGDSSGVFCRGGEWSVGLTFTVTLPASYIFPFYTAALT